MQFLKTLIPKCDILTVIYLALAIFLFAHAIRYRHRSTGTAVLLSLGGVSVSCIMDENPQLIAACCVIVLPAVYMLLADRYRESDLFDKLDLNLFKDLAPWLFFLLTFTYMSVVDIDELWPIGIAAAEIIKWKVVFYLNQKHPENKKERNWDAWMLTLTVFLVFIAFTGEETYQLFRLVTFALPVIYPAVFRRAAASVPFDAENRRTKITGKYFLLAFLIYLMVMLSNYRNAFEAVFYYVSMALVTYMVEIRTVEWKEKQSSLPSFMFAAIYTIVCPVINFLLNGRWQIAFDNLSGSDRLTYRLQAVEQFFSADGKALLLIPIVIAAILAVCVFITRTWRIPQLNKRKNILGISYMLRALIFLATAILNFARKNIAFPFYGVDVFVADAMILYYLVKDYRQQLKELQCEENALLEVGDDAMEECSELADSRDGFTG